MHITLEEIEKRIKKDLERVGFEDVSVINGEVGATRSDDMPYRYIDHAYAYLKNLKKLYKFFYENPNALEGFRSDVKSQELLQILYNIFKEDFKLTGAAPPATYKILFEALGIRNIYSLNPEQLHLLKKEKAPEIGGVGSWGIVSINKPKNVAIKYTEDSNEIQIAAYLAFKFHSTGKIEDHIQNIYDICQKDVSAGELKTTITKYETDILKPVELEVSLKQDIPRDEIPREIYRIFGYGPQDFVQYARPENLEIFEEKSEKELIKFLEDLSKSSRRLRELGIAITDYSVQALPVMGDPYKVKVAVNNIMINPQGNYIFIDYGSRGVRGPGYFKIPKCFTEETILSVNEKYNYVKKLEDLSKEISQVPNRKENDK